MQKSETVTPNAATAQSPKKPSGLTFAAVTLGVLGLVSWLAQLTAASAFGIVEYFRFDVQSTGGLIALVAAIVMWAKCRTWQTWLMWIWLPIAITVLLAFILMSVNARTVAAEEAAVRVRDEQAQGESERQAADYQACMDLQMQIEAKESEIQALQAKLDPSTRPSWVVEPPSWALPSAVNEHDRLVTEFNSAC